MNLNRPWTFEPNSKNMALMIISLCFNMLAYVFTSHMHWPIMLNCVGTFFTAIYLGPFAGMIAGGCYGVIMAFIQPAYLLYSIPHSLLGLIVGVAFPKNLSDTFQVAITTAMTIIASTVFNAPINLLLHKGYTTNYWGDALIDMICQNGNLNVLAAFAGEALVNIPDRLLSLSVVYIILYLKQKLTASYNNTLEE